ncbi:LANO_0G10594g1_1 [Lachancea nothofagi CBS 11611]|uniref:LANO_0G10594g1_1 n=1 Tax=Lachancea nothofagi CBS 11611 TaxID=1266666 RepID=A0A1G4KJ77_9SACH|nr:LANO_0G10594g1_1 [Lachancea nothofagi CBS 11611]
MAIWSSVLYKSERNIVLLQLGTRRCRIDCCIVLSKRLFHMASLESKSYGSPNTCKGFGCTDSHIQHSVHKPQQAHLNSRSGHDYRHQPSQILINKLNELFDFRHFQGLRADLENLPKDSAKEDYTYLTPTSDMDSNSYFAPLDLHESESRYTVRVNDELGNHSGSNHTSIQSDTYRPLSLNNENRLFLHDLISGDIYEEE